MRICELPERDGTEQATDTDTDSDTDADSDTHICMVWSTPAHSIRYKLETEIIIRLETTRYKYGGKAIQQIQSKTNLNEFNTLWLCAPLARPLE